MGTPVNKRVGDYSIKLRELNEEKGNSKNELSKIAFRN